MKIALSKIGKSALTATDPNDFIFSSDYNTFKIIVEGDIPDTIPSFGGKTIQVAHGLPFIPLVTAFAFEDGYTSIFPPNSPHVIGTMARLGYLTTELVFNYISADEDYIYFNFTNTSVSDKDVIVHFYCLEAI
jgi:hypothetical protein